MKRCWLREVVEGVERTLHIRNIGGGCSIPSRQPPFLKGWDNRGPDFMFGGSLGTPHRSRSIFSLGHSLIGQDRGSASGIEGQIRSIFDAS